MDAKLKHLEFIQGIANRLATDSFRLKGWTVVLVSALIVLLAREGRIEIAPVALGPVIVFWGSTVTSCGRNVCSAPCTTTSDSWRSPRSTSRWMSARSGQTTRGLGWVLLFPGL